MIRGFVSGFLTGGLFSALVLAAVAVVAPPLDRTVPPLDVAPAVSPGAEAPPLSDAPAGAVTPVAPIVAPDAQDAPASDAPAAPTPATVAPAPAKPATPTPVTPAPATPAPVVPEPAAPAPAAPDPAAPAPAAPAPAANDAATPEPAGLTPVLPAADDAPVPAADAPGGASPAKPAEPIPANLPAQKTAPAIDTAGTTALATSAPPKTDQPAAESTKLAKASETAPPVTRTAVAPMTAAPKPDAVVVPATDLPAVAAAQIAPDRLGVLKADASPSVPAAPAAPPKIATGDIAPPAAPPKADPAPALLAQALPKPETPATRPAPIPAPVRDDAAPVPAEPPLPRILTGDAPLADKAAPTLPPVARLGNGADNVVTGRLPRIGVEAAPKVTAAAAPQQTPIARNAARFDNPDRKPVFSVILIDTGAPDLDRAALAALPFAVSFALDPLDPAAADHAAIYRKAGREVLMLANGIPEGATASDLEVSFAALSERLPEAVAVIDQPQPLFQNNRPLATQIVPILAAQGRGLVTWDEGLNAADQVARSEGLPAAVAFRNLDDADESAQVVRRYLDRAAFRAAQDGRVVVVGHTRPETVEALVAWAETGRSSTVALAPITAAMVVAP